jgi:hypothetical protein
MMRADSTIRMGEVVELGTLQAASVRGKLPKASSADAKLTMRCVIYSYNHYVELIEPAGPRGCIRCCDDPDDCPVHEGEPALLLTYGWMMQNDDRQKWMSQRDSR